MIIKNINVRNYGPFSTTTLIKFDPEVTILTGTNDTGKTSVLRLIELLWTRGSVIEDEVNIDRILTSTVSWDEDPEVGCTIQLRGTNLTRNYINRDEVKEGVEIEARFQFAPKSLLRIIDYIQTNGSRVNPNANHFTGNPKVVFFASDTENIHPIINLEAPNSIEDKLLTLAFGDNPLKRFRQMNPWNLSTSLAGLYPFEMNKETE